MNTNQKKFKALQQIKQNKKNYKEKELKDKKLKMKIH